MSNNCVFLLNQYQDYLSVNNSVGNIYYFDASTIDTSSVTNMNSMFRNWRNIRFLDLSSFDTSKVTSMYSMFSGCNYLSYLNISSFNTSSVTDMASMFSGMNSILSLDLSNFDTSSVKFMSYMFSQCSYLKSLNLSSFNTSSVTEMGGMFQDCGYLSSLDLSSFDTSNVTFGGYSMFMGCYSLTNLTLCPNWGINTSDNYCYLADCPLTHDSCLDVFNKLADKTQTATTSATLTLKSTTKALMSDTEIAIATNKGWTVS